MKRWIWLLAAVCCLGNATAARGAGMIIIDDPHWWPGPGPGPAPWPPRPGPPPWQPRPIPRPPRVYPFAPLEVTRVDANTHIKDQFATTVIEEEFHNPNPSRLEGTF